MDSTLPDHELLGDRSRPENVLIFGSALAVIAIVIIVTSLLIRERASAKDFAARSASNIVKLIKSDVQRNIDLYDTSLQTMTSSWQRPEVQALTPQLRQQVLFDRFTAAPYKGNLLLLNEKGDVLADSLSIASRPDNFADREHFRAHQASPGLGLLISDPFKLRSGYGDWCITVSRRMSSSDGKFIGIASAAMRLIYFNKLFQSLDIGSNSYVNLINTNGYLLARQPDVDNEALIGKDFSQRENIRRFIKEGNGTFISVSSFDHQERLFTFSKVGDLPLVVVIGQSMEEVYGTWLRGTWLVGGATGVLCLGIFWLTFLLCRELRLRRCAEQGLAQLASTDGLTGLANRRQLDKVLNAEWMRGLRSGKTMSLLMIDVDHFKAFNDRHGHFGGDETLRHVAAAILANIRRPTDLAARYGGEEFSVILAETPLAGAVLIAEKIRAAVEALPTFSTDEQGVTVSIGVASQDHPSTSDPDLLISIADAALYQAKRNGRNRIECASACNTAALPHVCL